MSLENSNGPSKIKRRNFFIYLGAAIFGVLALSKSPLNLFKSRLNRDLSPKAKLSVRTNPYAVKRTVGEAKNG